MKKPAHFWVKINTASDERLEFQIEATPLATFNPYLQANDGTKQTVTLVHGVGAGKVCTLTVPNWQILNPGALEATDGIVETSLRGKALPGTGGNDQFTLAFS